MFGIYNENEKSIEGECIEVYSECCWSPPVNN